MYFKLSHQTSLSYQTFTKQQLVFSICYIYIYHARVRMKEIWGKQGEGCKNSTTQEEDVKNHQADDLRLCLVGTVTSSAGV